MPTRTQPYARKEAADYLGITVSTLDSYVRNGKLVRYYRFGRPCFRAADVERLSVIPGTPDERLEAKADRLLARAGIKR